MYGRLRDQLIPTDSSLLPPPSSLLSFPTHPPAFPAGDLIDLDTASLTIKILKHVIRQPVALLPFVMWGLSRH